MKVTIFSMHNILKNTFLKKIIKGLLEFNTYFFVFLNIFFTNKQKTPRVFFAGGKKGSIGGPLVKIYKLRKIFPDYKINFNLVYIASNNSFISKKSINIIKQNNINIIVNQNGIFYPAWFKGNYLKRNLEMSETYHAANYIFWQSKFCKKASDKFLGKRLGGGEILHNAVDTKIFIPRNSNNNDEIFTFLITGNILKINNYRINKVLFAIKEILKFNKNIRLIIAGQIEDKKYFISKIIGMNIYEKIKFIGKFNQIDAPKIYQLADAYITITYQDNCPSAVLEAMSCGLPILYSSSGGLPELVDINSGIGLPVEKSWVKIHTPNCKDIVDGMLKIIENKKSMSESARMRATENFDIQNWIDRHKIIFNELLK